METVREQVTGALAQMGELEVKKVWDIIQIVMSSAGVPVVELDEVDLAMIKEIKENPDCKEFVSVADSYSQLGWK